VGIPLPRYDPCLRWPPEERVPPYPRPRAPKIHSIVYVDLHSSRGNDLPTPPCHNDNVFADGMTSVAERRRHVTREVLIVRPFLRVPSHVLGTMSGPRFLEPPP